MDRHAARRLAHRATRNPSAGLTLIEVLVAVAIIGILFALLLVALQGAREANRRTVCQSRLRQIGIAMQAYHAAQGALPPAVVWSPPGEPLGGGELPIGVIDRVARYGTPEQDTIYANWLIALLPHLGESGLHQAFDDSVPLSHPNNARLRSAPLVVAACPSDPFNDVGNPYARGLAAGLTGNLYARGNFAINVGPDSNCVKPGSEDDPCVNGFFVDALDLEHRNRQAWGSGIAGANKSFRLADVTDGLSETVAVDEIRAGLDRLDPRGVWALGQVGASALARHGRFSNTGGPNACDFDGDQFIGCAALEAELGEVRLRGQCMDCQASSLESEINAKGTARSMHPGGVNVMMCDGSVRFVVDGIEIDVWHAMHTRNLAEQPTTDP